jgi:hypothetical protein
MSVNMASSSLVFLQPTVEAINLGATLAELKDPHLIEETFNEHLFLPASDQRSRPGQPPPLHMLCTCTVSTWLLVSLPCASQPCARI